MNKGDMDSGQTLADTFAAVASALAELIADPDKRQRLGKAGYERLRDRFSMDTGLKL